MYSVVFIEKSAQLHKSLKLNQFFETTSFNICVVMKKKYCVLEGKVQLNIEFF